MDARVTNVVVERCAERGRWPTAYEPLRVVRRAISASAQTTLGGPLANGRAYGRSTVGATTALPMRRGAIAA